MKQTPFEFQGRTYQLSFTAAALFQIYDKYGMDGDILAPTHFMDNTHDGLTATCWLGALLAAQGELQRRYMGEDSQPMLSAEELRRFITPAEITALRTAIHRAAIQGLRRDNQPDEEAEVDVVLAERAAAQKKTKALANSVLSGLRQALASLGSLSGRSSS